MQKRNKKIELLLENYSHTDVSQNYHCDYADQEVFLTLSTGIYVNICIRFLYYPIL